MASSSSSLNWIYDVFLSFRGEDVRVTFRSHFLKELDRKLISAFKDNEIKRSHSLWPELVQAIRTSRIAVVIFSKNYASSSWCLNELLEIVNCNDNIVIPVFYGLDPSHVRNQTGHFGRIFQETCNKNTEKKQNQWKRALTDVANMLGFHSATWDDEAKMIEVLADDVLDKLLLTSSKDSEDLVGIEAHIAEMSLLLQLKSEEVRMVGILGSSGIGKTTIARILFNRLSRHFQGSIFVDRGFLYKSKEIYSKANPDDPNMKLHLQNHFLSEILGKKDIKIDHLDALGERLKHEKVLIVIDDLDDQVVLDTLVGQTQWFGYGSRIIVATNDKHFLRAHGIDHIYEVSLPTELQAFQMLCRSAFKQNYAPEGFGKLVVDVVRHAGNLPLGLNLLGKYLRGRDKEFWMDTLPRLENGLRLDDKIEKILRISYDGLGSAEDQSIFRHIACFFNHMEETTIKLLLADSNLDVNIALKTLADKSLIHVREGYVVMHRSLQEMGRKIVRTQSIDKLGEREFLVDPKDISHVLSEGIGAQKVLGISLDTSEINELRVHENAFKEMNNLCFLEFFSKNFREEGRLHLPESFDYLPSKLKLLCWPKYPMSCMPSNFHPENLVKLEMQSSKLHKLWEGVVSLTCLKEIDMWGSEYLKEIPDLSMATNLRTLCLGRCESLVELPSSIRNLNKLLKLDMRGCISLKIIPTGFNLKSLEHLDFNYCSKLRTFPEFSTNISDLYLFGTNIEEFPSDLHLENLVRFRISEEESDRKLSEEVKKPNWRNYIHMSKLKGSSSLKDIPDLSMAANLETLCLGRCESLKILPTGLNFPNCSKLRTFPEFSTNISDLNLLETNTEEFPSNFNLENLVRLWTSKEESDWKQWEGAKPSPTVKHLLLENIPSLVELPSSFQYLNQLKMLIIRNCRNLETLPSGINFQSLDYLSLFGCSRLRSFPEISSNISWLYLDETGIEEVPWQIEKFSNLKQLTMKGCSKLKCLSLNIPKLKHLWEVDFSNCRALTRVDLIGYPSGVEMEADDRELNLNFMDCFNLNIDALIQQQSIIFNSMILSGEEVPSYFTHHTTGSSSLTIPLLHVPLSQPFFRFRVGAVVTNIMYGEAIKVNCKFKGNSFGNSFDVGFDFFVSKMRTWEGGHNILTIVDCRIPLHEDNALLAQRNYDHVDMHIHIRSPRYDSNDNTLKVKGWGIRVLKECSFPENRRSRL